MANVNFERGKFRFNERSIFSQGEWLIIKTLSRLSFICIFSIDEYTGAYLKKYLSAKGGKQKYLIRRQDDSMIIMVITVFEEEKIEDILALGKEM